MEDQVTEPEAPARRGRPRSATASRAILESAYRLMATSGAGAASIEAIARDCGASKMTIYKWWPTREALLIDAFLHHAETMLPLKGRGSAIQRIRAHAERYATALAGEFGRVQLAVIAECITASGSAEEFNARYLGRRRTAIVAIITAGQVEGSIAATADAETLYDAIYGALFYRSAFAIEPLTPAYARELTELALSPR
ncbi:TetR/AcrR family transcriptional regulator [Roseococcus sp. YIM B11640]|uniref:TetR/AcrR family transcriptional regulator n=1 Tax=Roseococcus sp. YIM B11640 TaxID=3133973 RepID=UPI003C7DB847